MRRVRLGLALLTVLVIGAVSALGLAYSQERSRTELKQRFQAKAALAASFVSTYTTQLMERERAVATSTMSTQTDSFATAVQAFGFPAAVLLDAQGRVLQIAPAKPASIGVAIASKYPHLTSAVHGVAAVSPVVPSAATGEPVVGFAVPYDTPSGRRVFSGAYAIKSTPLKAYVDAMVQLKGSRVFLVDSGGTIVTSSLPAGKVARMADVDAGLAAAVKASATGADGADFYTSKAVAATPWTIVAEVPSAVLLGPISGQASYLPWTILGLLVLAALAVCLLLFRLLDHRARLEVANAQLDKLVHLDALTGVRNRRSTVTEMSRAYATCQRTGRPMSVLMVDVDHFKRINDTFGHLAGDDVLSRVAVRFEGALRDGDVLGRWGGEEFVVVMPDTDHATAVVVAQRLCDAVRDATFHVGAGGDDITVTVSVGVAGSLRAVPDVLVHAADRALYAAKDGGRDRVHAHAT